MYIPLQRTWALPTQVYLRFFQDLFAYDFYLEQIYDKTIVFAVSTLAKFTSWFDRYVVDGLVNLVSLATIFSGNALRYNVSGQSQFYISHYCLWDYLYLLVCPARQLISRC